MDREFSQQLSMISSGNQNLVTLTKLYLLDQGERGNCHNFEKLK